MIFMAIKLVKKDLDNNKTTSKDLWGRILEACPNITKEQIINAVMSELRGDTDWDNEISDKEWSKASIRAMHEDQSDIPDYNTKNATKKINFNYE